MTDDEGLKSFAILPLPDSKTHIRLLFIKPGEGDNELSLSTTIHDINREHCEYTAISYEWGDEYPTRQISVDGQSVQVPHNCWHALWQMRHHHHSAGSQSLFWIDTLCIDQTNAHEKAVQVSMMGRIYADAQSVAACLGEIGALAPLFSLESDQDVERACRKSHQFQHDFTAAAVDLCTRPYLGRLWTVQECVRAREVYAYAGKARRRFAELINALDLQGDLMYDLGTAWVADRSRPTADEVSWIVSLNTHMETFAKRSGRMNLAEVILDFNNRQCTNPRDRLYAVIALLPDEVGQRIQVRYDQSLLQFLLRYVSIYEKLEVRYDTVAQIDSLWKHNNPPCQVNELFEAMMKLVSRFARHQEFQTEHIQFLNTHAHSNMIDKGSECRVMLQTNLWIRHVVDLEGGDVVYDLNDGRWPPDAILSRAGTRAKSYILQFSGHCCRFELTLQVSWLVDSILAVCAKQPPRLLRAWTGHEWTYYLVPHDLRNGDAIFWSDVSCSCNNLIVCRPTSTSDISTSDPADSKYDIVGLASSVAPWGAKWSPGPFGRQDDLLWCRLRMHSEELYQMGVLRCSGVRCTNLPLHGQSRSQLEVVQDDDAPGVPRSQIDMRSYIARFGIPTPEDGFEPPCPTMLYDWHVIRAFACPPYHATARGSVHLLDASCSALAHYQLLPHDEWGSSVNTVRAYV